MWTFPAMNTRVAVAAPELSEDAEHALALAVELLFRRTEQQFSRFLPDSELARLNRAEGPVVVSAELFALLVRARAHACETEGVFEPAVGAALQACGYDRSFASGVLDGDDAPEPTAAASIAQLELDEVHGMVTRPSAVQLDLGGFLKGVTVDRAAALASGSVAIEAGGDAVLRGDRSWVVEVEDPDDVEHVLGTLVVRDTAVATSAANRRHWRRGGHAMHHLIDPRTRLPAASDVVQATIVAPTAELADVMAKVAFVRGTAVIPELERRGLGAVLILADKTVRTVGDVELHHA